MSYPKRATRESPFPGRPTWVSVEFTPGGKQYHYWVHENWTVAEANEIEVTTPYDTKAVTVVRWGWDQPSGYYGAMRPANRVVSRRKDKPKAQSEAQLEVGDKVYVRPMPDPHMYEGQPGFDSVWNPEMDQYMGQGRVVERISKSGVLLKDTGFLFPPQMLEKVEDKLEAGRALHALVSTDLSGLEANVLAADHRWSYPPYSFNKIAAKPTPQENPVSIKIETITYVNNIPAGDLSDDAVFEIISRAEKEIERLEGISSRPVRIDKRIRELRKGIAQLVTLLNERDKQDSKGEDTASDS